MNRTLMQRLKGLPGATGNSPKNRKARKPEDKACLTLGEFERWLALEVGQRYHHSKHWGLHGATPYATWTTLVTTAPTRQLAPGPEEALKLLINFMPVARRTIQADGLTIFHIRYWHPVFAAWREDKRSVPVRYHPEDLSRVYACADGKNYVEARYADLRRPTITLWEQRVAVRALRAGNQPRISEALLFRALEQQREIVERARREAKRARSGAGPQITAERPPPPQPVAPAGAVDYSKPVDPFPVEIW